MRQTVDELRATIAHETSRWEGHVAQKDKHHAAALAAMEADNDALVKEMESQLATSEDERRSLKMKADQAMFELSRIRDQGQLQHNTDAKQINDLKRVNSILDKTKAELETSNNELSKRLTELESRQSTTINRRASPLPPQGPPPSTPLPPIPKSPTVANPPAGMTRLASNSSHQGHGNQRISAGSATDIQAIIATLPDGSQQNVQKVVSERDAAVQQKEMVKQLLAAGQDKLKDSVSAALWPSAGNKLTSRRQNWLKNDKRPRLLYVN
jgi:kinesin family protein 4/21/27